MIYPLKNDEEFERALAEAGDRVIVICFTSDLSLHWNQFQPTVEDFAFKYADINFYKVDDLGEGLRSIFNRGGVLPSFYFYKNGEEIDDVKGANQKELKCKLERFSQVSDKK